MPSSIIKSLRLQRFKNFRDATLSLGPFTVLIGTNASGKSNLRDAFRFVHGMGRGYTLAEIIGTKYAESGELRWEGIRGGMREIAFHGERSFSISTDLRHAGMRLKHQIEVDVTNQRYGPRLCQESLSWAMKQKVYATCAAVGTTGQDNNHQICVCLSGGEKNGKQGRRLRFLDNQPILSQLPERREVKSECKDAASRP